MLVVAALVLALLPGTPREIDVAASKASFGVAHVWVERVAGTVPILRGAVTLAPGALVPTSVTAELDATKIRTDEPDRDAALESPDFFDAAKYPVWTFVSRNVTPEGPTSFAMDGDLTIHGVTRPERLNVTIGGDQARPVYHATATVDRHVFGMATTRLDPTIGSSVDVRLDIVLR